MRRAFIMVVLVAGCRPDLGQPGSLVTEPRVLAVRGEPAEVRPKEDVDYTVLLAGPGGTEAAPALDWAFCTAPKPVNENNAVAVGCLGEQSITPIATGVAAAKGNIPYDACQRFGPDPPPQETGKPMLRPRDPDVTGGFYQPVRVRRDMITVFALERITCNLASAGAEIAIDFAQRYHANKNPKLLPLVFSTDRIQAGQPVTLTTGWTPESAETYPLFDAAEQRLIDQREALRVSWFSTGGSFEQERTGRGETEMETATQNVWNAPAEPGPAHLWVVLRDSRGGADFAAYDVTVVP